MAYQICPWSDSIKSVLEGYGEKVAVLDKLEAKWRSQIEAGQITPDDSRTAIVDLSDKLSEISDSPKLLSLSGLASSSDLLYWASTLANTRMRLSPADQSAFSSDVHLLLKGPGQAVDTLQLVLTLRGLMESTDSGSSIPQPIPEGLS